MAVPLPEDLEDLHFLEFEDVVQIHSSLLEPDQLSGVKSEDNLRSAVGRAQNAAYYDYDASIEKIAAYYWHGISANHAFHDGNKRAGFFSMLAFLEANGLEFVGPDDEMGEVIYALFEEDRFTVEVLQSIIERNIRRLV